MQEISNTFLTLSFDVILNYIYEIYTFKTKLILLRNIMSLNITFFSTCGHDKSQSKKSNVKWYYKIKLSESYQHWSCFNENEKRRRMQFIWPKLKYWFKSYGIFRNLVICDIFPLAILLIFSEFSSLWNLNQEK